MSVQICNTASEVLNTGASKQCIEGKLKHIVLSKSAFKFANVTDAVNRGKWIDGITAKDLVPLFDLYEVANADTEASFFEADEFRFKTSKEVKKTTFESYLGICSHKALKSYQDSDYTKVFEITEDGAIIGILNDDGSVSGQDLSYFDVSIRKRTVKDKPATTMVTLTYKDFEQLEKSPFGRIPDWDANDLSGIFNANITLVSATSSAIVVDVNTGCDSTGVEGLVVGDFTYSGGTLTGLSESTTVSGRYTLAGTGLTSGNLNLDGVVALGDILLEGVLLAVTI